MMLSNLKYIIAKKYLLILKHPALKNSPQAKGKVIRARVVTPRKPNSARRQVAKTALYNKSFVIARIPGCGHNIRKYSTVLIRGNGSRDTPNVKYSCIRGKYDFLSLLSKTKRRSIYGCSRPDHLRKQLRRKFRHLFKTN